MGAVFLDADNDSYLDLYVSGQEDGTDNLLPSAFYKNNNNLSFFIPNDIGLENDKRRSFANAIGDVNNDGLPEIFVVNENQSNFLWKNETTTTNNWLKVKLIGVDSNKDGIGNRIEVFANGKAQYRYTLCGEGYLGQNSSYEFFGLANATAIDYVKVTWNKSGNVEIIQNIDVNKSITIKEGNGILSTKNVPITNINVYPNPNNTGKYKVFFNNNTHKELSVFDVSGRNTFKLKTSQESIQLDLSSFSKGIYFLKVHSENKLKTFKLIKN